MKILLFHFLVRAQTPTLVTCHAAPLNPLQSVCGRKHDTTDGKTPALSIQQTRDLLRSTDISCVVGLRDRTVLGTLADTGNRAP